MPAQLCALTGPARCGKTERLLARYRQELARHAPGTTLWISPTQRSAAVIRGRLLGGSLAACLDPGVMTFAQFASAILAGSSNPGQQIDGVQQRDLFRRLVDEMSARGELKHFQPIAHTSGLIDLLVQFVRELKRLEIWPEEFQASCERLGATQKDREMWRLYTQYQETLTRHNLFDTEGRFWLARELLRNHPPARFAGLKLVVVDGFTDFTRTQHEMLEILAERVEELLISLPLEPPPVRAELFAKTLATLHRLRQRHPQLRPEVIARPGKSPWPIMQHVEAELFQNPRQFRQPPPVERIEVIAAASPLGEIETLARRIKTLLLEGDPQTGVTVRPGDIAIVFRSPREYVSLVREVFARFGLPTAIETGRQLGESRSIAAMLALLQLQLDDWPFRQLLAVLRNNFFRPAWPEATSAALDAAEQIIRKLQVPEGRQALLDRIRRWARLDELARGEEVPGHDPHWPEKLAERRRLAALGLPLLQRLGQALAVLTSPSSKGPAGAREPHTPRGATAAEVSAALANLAAETGLRKALLAPHDSVPLSSQEPIAWSRWTDALDGCHNLAEMLGEPSPRLPIEDWCTFLQDVARSEQLPSRHDETGCIRVLAAGSARALDIPYLFLAGLSEKSFPPAARDDGLYSESEIRRLALEGGLPLVLRAERNQEEMLLFYEVLTRASHQLYLSYPALDSKAQELLPSPYLIELDRVCGTGRIPLHRAADLSPLPPRSTPLCDNDFRVLAVAAGLAGDDNLLAARQVRGSQALFAGLRLTKERANRLAFGPYEGLFNSDAARAVLAARFGPEHLWSASHLEAYASCPFKFFAERVLGISPLTEISLETDYLTRGGLLHGMLADLHRRVNSTRGGVPTSPRDLADEEFAQHYEDALTSLMSLADSDDALASALREIDQRLIRLWTRRYRVQHDDYSQLWQECDTPPLPAHFEVSFGVDPPAEDPRSKLDPLVLQCGEDVLRLSGRIDRLDIGQVGGQAVFNVLDYKSGRKRAKAGSEVSGQSLQLELYSIAAEQVLLADLNAVPWHAGYWHVQLKQAFETYVGFHESGDSGVQPTATWQERRQKLLARVGEIAQGIRRGEFPVFSLDDDCTGRCPFNTVCRVNQVRSLEKSWPSPPPNQA